MARNPTESQPAEITQPFPSQTLREEKHLPPAGRRRLQDDWRRFSRALRRLLDEGKAENEFDFADVNTAAQAITELTTWLYAWYQPNGPKQPAVIADEIATMALRVVDARA